MEDGHPQLSYHMLRHLLIGPLYLRIRRKCKIAVSLAAERPWALHSHCRHAGVQSVTDAGERATYQDRQAHGSQKAKQAASTTCTPKV